MNRSFVPSSIRPLSKPLLLASLVATALFASYGYAADLKSVYQEALTSDPSYQAARFENQTTKERLPQAKSALGPQVAANASIGENRTYFRDPGTNLLGQANPRTSGSGTRSYGVSLSQPLYRAQSNIVVSQAELQLKAAEARLADAQQDLIVRVAQAYFDVLLARDNVALSEAQKRAFGEQLAQAQRNFEVGTATIVDTLEAQARFDQTNAREIADKNDLEVKLRALEQLTGKRVQALDPLRDPLDLQGPQPNNLDSWVTASNERSFAIAQTRLALDTARLEIDRTKAANSPTIDAVGNVSGGRSPRDNFGPLGPSSVNAGISIQLSVPLYTSGLNESRTREATANRDRTEQDLERIRRAVNQSVRQFFLNVTSGIAQVRALEQALASTQKQLESTILGRDVGVRTGVDVLNAQQGVFQTRRDLQAARYNYLMSTLRLKAAAGDLTDADVEKVNLALDKGR
jgi:outer membrane protein